MTKYSRALMGLCAVMALVGRAAAKPPPGPPWPVNFPMGTERPASDAPAKDFAFAEVEASGAPIGVGVAVSAAIAKPTLGAKYELYYQLRVHNKKGEMGPLLATMDHPDGKAFFVRNILCEFDWIEFYEKFDVTRKDVSAMTNLPSREGNGSDKEVLIRVEPQLYDPGERKYLTPGKTPAAIMVATVGAGGKVWSLQSLGSWLIEKGKPGSDAKKALATLAELDEYSPAANGVDEALLTVINAKETSAETKALYVGAVPADSLKTKSGYNLKVALEGLAASGDEAVKSAAKKKLAEAK